MSTAPARPIALALLLAALPCAAALAGCNRAKAEGAAARGEAARGDASSMGAPATANPSAAIDASAAVTTSASAAPACAPLEPAKVAPFECDDRVVKLPVPAIEDEGRNLAPFFDRLAALARGDKARVRVAVYGDSNLTSDFLTGHLRRVLQGRFGDAGHGWVSFSRPWGSYRHEDVEHAGYWALFDLYAPTTHIARDKQYGFANMAAESRQVGAAAWARTATSAKAKVGKSVGSFELHYLKQPRGGSFEVLLDGVKSRVVSTESSEFEAGVESIETTDAAHELRCVVKGDGPVRFFGASLDRDVPGIQIDSLGAGSLTYERLRWVSDGTRRVQLAKRAYDLVVVWLGANIMWVKPNEAWAKEFIGQLRAAIPNVPVLLLGPADIAQGSSERTAPRIPELITQLRGVAKETGVAFWDFREAMGGDGASARFTRRGLTGEDHVHFGPQGSALMGDRLLCAMSTSLSAHLAASPSAGCGGRGDPSPASAGRGETPPLKAGSPATGAGSPSPDRSAAASPKAPL